MRAVVILFFYVLSTALAQSGEGASSSSILRELSFDVEHSFGSEFQLRSNFLVTVKADGKQMSNATEKNGLFPENIELFKALLLSNELYRIKVSASGGDSFAIAALPACELQKSGFKEEIMVHVDPSGNVVGLAYSSPVFALPRPCDPSKLKTTPVYFHTRMRIVEPTPAQSVPLNVLGPRPPHLANIRIDEDGSGDAAGGAGSKPQQQSFLQRYWYVVVIMVLYLFLGGREEPKKKAGEAAAGGSESKKNN